MPTQLIFSWPEKNIQETFTALNFRNHFADLIGDCQLFTGEFDPPIQLDNKAKTKIGKIYFSDITFVNGKLLVEFGEILKQIKYKQQDEPFKFKIITPGKITPN